MKKTFFMAGVPAVMVVIMMGLSLSAWNQQAESKVTKTDTAPHREKQIRNFDDAMEDLDRSSVELEKNLRSLPEIKTIDAEKMRADIERSFKELDAVKLQQEIKASVSKIDFEKMKADLARLKEIELPKIEAQMKDLKPRIEASMEEAKKSIEKAKAEIREYKAFEEGLQKDGLIDKENYIIEHHKGVLKINGKVQSQEVYDKYRSFLEKHKDLEIKKNKDEFNIHNDSGSGVIAI
jgi:hypothetical protein